MELIAHHLGYSSPRQGGETVPLFVCDECGTVDNTALGGYWQAILYDLPALCAVCRTGKWHGHFDREIWDGQTPVVNRTASQPRRDLE